MKTYPFRTVHDSAGRTVAVCGDTDAPAYADLPRLSGIAECGHLASILGGFVMQQDDEYLPPFTLYSAR